MAQLDREAIKKLTALSRIKCTEEEEEQLLIDLQKILTYAEQLSEIDTEGITPCNHVLEGMVNVGREDRVGRTLPREVFLANAPDKIGGMVRVPPVLKSSS